ncbi:MAG: DUF1801 domain-containing protein [Rhodospirillaceae bacterium]
MSELKTKQNSTSVASFIKAVENPKRREDTQVIKKMMDAITGWKPKMWGDSIVGYGAYHYKYASGREGDWFVTGFSPRKQAVTVYIMPGFSSYENLMAKLGKYKTGKSCLYINRLEDIDLKVLEKLIRQSITRMKKIYTVT